MKKILFVCHGNICRSPMAEFVISRHSDHEKVLKLQGFRDFFFFCCEPENRLISNSFLTPSFELSTGKKATHLVHYGLLPSHIQMPVDIGGHFYI